jgi:hypothetical protein
VDRALRTAGDTNASTASTMPPTRSRRPPRSPPPCATARKCGTKRTRAWKGDVDARVMRCASKRPPSASTTVLGVILLEHGEHSEHGRKRSTERGWSRCTGHRSRAVRFRGGTIALDNCTSGCNRTYLPSRCSTAAKKVNASFSTFNSPSVTWTPACAGHSRTLSRDRVTTHEV